MSATKELLYRAEQERGDNEPGEGEDMKRVPESVYWAFFSSGRGAALGGERHVPVRETLAEGACPLRGQHIGEVVEFVAPDGSVLARKVTACGERECWLRTDLVAAAEAVVEREAAEVTRIKDVIIEEMNRRDSALAAARGETLECFREQRNYRGMRWDRARAANRAGGL